MPGMNVLMYGDCASDIEMYYGMIEIMGKDNQITVNVTSKELYLMIKDSRLSSCKLVEERAIASLMP